MVGQINTSGELVSYGIRSDLSWQPASKESERSD